MASKNTPEPPEKQNYNNQMVSFTAAAVILIGILLALLLPGSGKKSAIDKLCRFSAKVLYIADVDTSQKRKRQSVLQILKTIGKPTLRCRDMLNKKQAVDLYFSNSANPDTKIKTGDLIIVDLHFSSKTSLINQHLSFRWYYIKHSQNINE